MDFSAGREEHLRHWFCAFGRKEENKPWHWAGIIISMTDVMTLPLVLLLCLQQCVSLGYFLTKAEVTEPSWSRGTQDLTRFFLLRVKRTLNSNLLFYPVRSGKNPSKSRDSCVEGWMWLWGNQGTENSPNLTHTAPNTAENTGFDLRLWKRLPNLETTNKNVGL